MNVCVCVYVCVWFQMSKKYNISDSFFLFIYLLVGFVFRLFKSKKSRKKYRNEQKWEQKYFIYMKKLYEIKRVHQQRQQQQKQRPMSIKREAREKRERERVCPDYIDIYL